MKPQQFSALLAGLLVLTACTVPVPPPPPGAPAPAAQEAAAPAAPAVVVAATPAAPVSETGLGDKYYPLAGNPGYDAQHYTIELAADVATNTITGTTTLAALATNGLDRFNLDFLGLDVAAVTVDGAAAAFSRDGQELTVTPASPIAAGTPFSVSVTYGGVPEPYPDPALSLFQATVGWQKWGDGVLAAAGQPDGSMTWFPSNNHPSDKATYTFRLTVDDPYVALANGVLQEVIPVDGNKKTYVWEMAQPMATMVALAAVGEFERHESVAPTGVKIRNYFLKGTDQAFMDSFAVTGDMMSFLTDLFGDYPFEEYGVVAVPGFALGNALETQTLSIFGDPAGSTPDPQVILHELFHQWIGNTVTIADWPDLWLAEGFSKYAEALWLEKTQGVDAYNALIQQQFAKQLGYGQSAAQLGHPEVPAGGVIPPVDPGVRLLFLPTYSGGAVAFHMLRLEVGDDVFFNILRTYYQEHKGKPVTTADFIATAETVAGRDLSSVWDTWLYGTAVPKELPLLPGGSGAAARTEAASKP